MDGIVNGQVPDSSFMKVVGGSRPPSEPASSQEEEFDELSMVTPQKSATSASSSYSSSCNVTSSSSSTTTRAPKPRPNKRKESMAGMLYAGIEEQERKRRLKMESALKAKEEHETLNAVKRQMMKLVTSNEVRVITTQEAQIKMMERVMKETSVENLAMLYECCDVNTEAGLQLLLGFLTGSSS